MVTVSIPKEITKGEELVIIPKKLYEKFMHALKLKTKTEVLSDKNLLEALEDVKKGKVEGPFSSINDGLKFLKKSKFRQATETPTS